MVTVNVRTSLEKLPPSEMSLKDLKEYFNSMAKYNLADFACTIKSFRAFKGEKQLEYRFIQEKCVVYIRLDFINQAAYEWFKLMISERFPDFVVEK